MHIEVPVGGPAADSLTPPGRGARRSLRLKLYLLLLVTDLLCIGFAFALSDVARYFDLTFSNWQSYAIVTMAIYVGIAFNTGAYSIDALRSRTRSVTRAAAALAFTLASLLLVAFFLRLERESSRALLAGVTIFSGIFLVISRRLIGSLTKRISGGSLMTEVLICDDIDMLAPPGVTLIDACAAHLRPNLRDPMMLDRLASALKGVDRVVIACRPEAKRAWAMLLKGANIHGEVLAQEFDAVGAIGVDTLDGQTTLVVATGPLSVQNRIIKRTLDLALCVPALVALAPVLIITAIAVKLDSPGPVFFKQKRVGRGNALFEIYKFRSMRVESSDEAGNRSATRDDDRITRVGRIIRKTSIDELPQLLNVLFGSMSLVGPRPHALGSLAGEQLFWEVDERYWHRHALKPGITGLAQVRGFRGATHRRDDLTRRLQADLEYVQGWSVWRDIAILLSTVRVIMHSNAY